MPPVKASIDAMSGPPPITPLVSKRELGSSVMPGGRNTDRGRPGGRLGAAADREPGRRARQAGFQVQRPRSVGFDRSGPIANSEMPLPRGCP